MPEIDEEKRASKSPNDNYGRRQKVFHSTVLNSDPFYRRVKDGILVILGIAAAASSMGIDFSRILNIPRAEAKEQQLRTKQYNDIRERLIANEVSIRDLEKVTESSLKTVDRKIDRMDDKFDRLLTREIERGQSYEKRR